RREPAGGRRRARRRLAGCEARIPGALALPLALPDGTLLWARALASLQRGSDQPLAVLVALGIRGRCERKACQQRREHARSSPASRRSGCKRTNDLRHHLLPRALYAARRYFARDPKSSHAER